MHKQKVTTKLGSRKSIFPKVTKMGSIFGHKIDYYGVGVLRGQRHIPVRSNFNPSKGWFSYAAKLKCLWHSRRYCLRYYSDIWEDNAAGRKKHRRSWAPSCLRSRTRVNFAGMTAVKTCDGFCCRRLVFSYRNGIADSTGRRVGVISQVAPRHMRTGLNARSPLPPPHLQEKVSQRQVRRQLRRWLCIKFVSLFWEDRRGLDTTNTVLKYNENWIWIVCYFPHLEQQCYLGFVACSNRERTCGLSLLGEYRKGIHLLRNLCCRGLRHQIWRILWPRSSLLPIKEHM